MNPRRVDNLNPFQVPDLNDPTPHASNLAPPAPSTALPAAATDGPTTHIVHDQLGNPITFTGELIGSGTTQRDEHSHDLNRVAAKGERCFACRWFEAYIYAVETLPTNYPPRERFLVATVGGTVVDGERTFYRAHVTSSGFEVVELLTIRKSGAAPYMSTSAARALSQAAEVDEVIREAYVNRAVA